MKSNCRKKQEGRRRQRREDGGDSGGRTEETAAGRPTKIQEMSECGNEEEVRPVSPVTSYVSMVTDWPEDHASSVGDETLCSDLSDEPGSDRQLSGAEFSDTQCKHLASALKSKRSSYKQLDLSRNSVTESGAELLSAGLESPNCRLETLRLSDCILSERWCASLVSALSSNPSHLRELDLSGNKYLTDSGVKLLSAGLGSPHCRLKTLRLVCCELTESSCASLLSALQSNLSSLKELDLSGNHLQDSGVKLLCSGLKSPHCTLETLRFSCCKLSENSCDSLASALKSHHSHLKELDLSLNQLRDSGMKMLSAGLTSPHCGLKTLRLICCLFSDEGCASLVSALKSRPSDLTELDLSGNELRDQGEKLLSELVQSPLCQVKTLRVEYGRNLITPASCKKSGLRFSLGPNTTAADLSEDKTEEVKDPSSSTKHHTTGISDWFSDFSPTATKSEQPASHSAVAEVLSQWTGGKTPTTSGFRKRLHADKTLDSGFHKILTKRKQSTSPDAAVDVLTPPMIKTPSDDSHLTPDPSWFSDPLRFTPEVVTECGVTSYRFRGPRPGVYQCDSTGLVFTMTRDGDLSYRIVQWDEHLLQAAGKIPAGPLFNIKCSEDAVSQLKLPHCGTKSALPEDLSVVHISDDGMNILEPQEITETHVVVDVPHLSAFGLVWNLIKSFLNIQKPISGQVLLFHQPANTRPSQKLNVFLLPENVPVREVKGQQEKAEYIEAPSTCTLMKGQTYSLDCPEACKVQPAFALFDFKYGPNYHPTFEIRLTSSTEEATVTVQDPAKRHVWEYHVELTGLRSASSSAALSVQPRAAEPAEEGGPDQIGQNPSRMGEEEKKLFSVRTQFIDRVSTSVLKDLLDVLLQNRVVNSREMESTQAMPRADRARELIDTVLKKGNPACRILIDTFCEVDPFLSALLQLN